MSEPTKRPISEITREILREWKNPYFGFKPYGEAMLHLTDATTPYLYETGADILPYALSNMQTFKGDKARRLKGELKEHYGSKLTTGEKKALADWRGMMAEKQARMPHPAIKNITFHKD